MTLGILLANLIKEIILLLDDIPIPSILVYHRNLQYTALASKKAERSNQRPRESSDELRQCGSPSDPDSIFECNNVIKVLNVNCAKRI